MVLSTDLVSQFAKATKDNPEVRKERTVYGTIVMQDGVKYVKIDGSDLLTPISTTTNVYPGERVTVMIKNHTATVTGNISSPAARIDDVSDTAVRINNIENTLADKVDIETFNTESKRIDEIQKQLTANTADIAELKAIISELTASA